MSWRDIKLGEAFSVKHGFAFKSMYFSNEGSHLVLTPGNFHEEGGFRLRPDKDRAYSGDLPEDYVLKQGDVIVAMTEQGPGLLGSSAIVPEGNRYLHNQRLGLIESLDESVLNKRFLYYLFNAGGVRGQISGSASGTKVRHTSPERIYRVRVRIPHIECQTRIADILSAYDDLIENNRRRMALLEEAARQLYREWFVRLRFPGHEHTRMTNGVPEGWNKKRLADVADVNKQSFRDSYDDEIDYIDISSVTPSSINETTRYVFRDAPSRARRVVKHGDIIWSCVRPNRRSYAVIWQPSSNLIASTGFAVITPTGLPTTFLLQATTTDAFVGYLENHARGVAYPAVVAGDFERAEILVPHASLIGGFNEWAEPLLAQANTLRLQNEKVRAARDLLLPRLMSGEIAV